MNATPTNSTKRSPWPYAIGGYFALAITGIAIFITWAVKQNMDLVRRDYYEHEILFQKQIDAANRTRPWSKEIAIRYDERALWLQLPPAHAAQLIGHAHLYRPSDARQDRVIELKVGEDGKQTINSSLQPGLWKVRLDWSVNGESFTFEQALVVGG